MSTRLQNEYDSWECYNPVWARRLTGPDAARALGYGGPRENEHASRSDMVTASRLRQRSVAYRSSGFSDEIQSKLTQHDPETMVTSLSRATTDPTLNWVDDPPVKTRSQLRADRRIENVVTLDQQAEHHKIHGKPDAEQRVQNRIDQSIKFIQNATAKGSKSRAELLDSRRRERADKALSDYVAYQPQQPPRYDAQEQPYWKLDKAHERSNTSQQVQQQQAEARKTAARTGASLEQPLSSCLGEASSSNQPHVPPPPPDLAAREKATLPSGALSADMLNAERRWWVKPEHYPKVAPAAPQRDDPFKLKPDETSYLHLKLSSGPKKDQRGYGEGHGGQSATIVDKVTALPPPSLAEAMARDPFRQYSGATFKFLPHEPREMVPGSSDTNADGYEFTQPLYSSFTADRTFQPPKLPQRPTQRLQPAVRERRPQTGAVGVGAVGGGPKFGNTGPAAQPRAMQKASPRPNTVDVR